jgi:hypothetical protein
MGGTWAEVLFLFFTPFLREKTCGVSKNFERARRATAWINRGRRVSVPPPADDAKLVLTSGAPPHVEHFEIAWPVDGLC